ncbi:MAG: MFS transporter [Thaumarchaeota archaeon]|nr:MFS transporter [Nitrososphaerota archaeon]
MFTEYRGIPWEAKLLIYLSLIPNVAIGFLYTDLSFFLSDVRGFDPAAAGTTIGVMGASLVVASFPVGILADRYGRRRMLVLGNVCASLSLIGFSLPGSVSLVLMVAALEGVGEAAYAVSVGSLLAEKAGNEKRTVAFSLFAFLGWVSGAIGGFAISSVTLLQGFGLTGGEAHMALYATVALLSLSTTPLIFKVRESTRSAEGTRRKGLLPRKSGGVLIKEGLLALPFYIATVLYVFGISLYWFLFKDAKLPEESGGPAQVPSQSSSLEGPEETR